MDFKRSLYAIVFMAVLIDMNSAGVIVSDKVNALTKQLIQEAKEFGFKIDESQIEIVYSKEEGNAGVIVGAPLSKTIDTTSKQIENGEVYVGVQCVSTEKINGCFKVRLAGADKRGIKLDLINNDGTVLASKTVSSPNELGKRAVTASKDLAATNEQLPSQAQNRYVWCVWINGYFIGCYDEVIIIFDKVTLIFNK